MFRTFYRNWEGVDADRHCISFLNGKFSLRLPPLKECDFFCQKHRWYSYTRSRKVVQKHKKYKSWNPPTLVQDPEITMLVCRDLFSAHNTLNFPIAKILHRLSSNWWGYLWCFTFLSVLHTRSNCRTSRWKCIPNERREIFVKTKHDDSNRDSRWRTTFLFQYATGIFEYKD